MKFLDLFAGIGGFRLGLESAGHECVGFCEIDKFARASYKAIHNTEGEVELHDITKVTDEEWRKLRGTVDIICGGFPCQAFSIAGKRKGFLDETRGTLFFEIARATKEIKPPLLFLENVKGLLSHDKGRTFRTILSTLDELGYDAEWQVLNSKDFGVPQNRERVFIIGHLRGERTRQILPIRGESGTTNQESSKVVIPVLTPDRANKRQNGRRFKTDGEPMFTLTAQDRHGVAVLRPVRTKYGKEIRKAYENGEVEESRHNMTKLEPRQDRISNTITTVQKDNSLKVYDFYNKSFRRNGTIGTLTANGGGSLTHCGTFGISDGIRIRKLTPRECWRLQGFPDWAFDKAQEVNSNSQLYKQAGNSVTVNVIKEIAERLG